ncbi:MAG: hypothetical protein AB7D51_01190 [Desulfovibrionaceae bacterium]
MEKVFSNIPKPTKNETREPKLYVPYPGADEKYEDGQDWRIYNPDKYRDPNWSPDKE